MSENIQHHLQAIIDSAGESWTYAIFWQSYPELKSILWEPLPAAESTILGWGDGYYKGGGDPSLSLAVEQEYQKSWFKSIYRNVFGNTERFFWFSKYQMFVDGAELPGQSFVSNKAVWIAGPDRLASSTCERARKAQLVGLQTMVCIPFPNGVVELGSSDLIFQSPDLMNQVRVLFNDGYPKRLWFNSFFFFFCDVGDDDDTNQIEAIPKLQSSIPMYLENLRHRLQAKFDSAGESLPYAIGMINSVISGASLRQLEMINLMISLASLCQLNMINLWFLKCRLGAAKALKTSSTGRWTYAILWQHSAAESLLKHDLHIPDNGEDEDDSSTYSASLIKSMISGYSSDHEFGGEDIEMTRSELFFDISMSQSFVIGAGLPGQSFLSNEAVWIAGRDRLASSTCKRARIGHLCELQTMVFIPVPNGVVELGSSDLIVQSPDLMNQVKVLFNGSNAINQIEAPPPLNVGVVEFGSSSDNRQRLQAIMDSTGKGWTYAIFWQHSAVKSLLGWGDGYYKVLNPPLDTDSFLTGLVNSFISNYAVPDTEEVICDTKRFFWISMTQLFVNGAGLPGQSFVSNEAVWIAGQDGLSSSTCERAQKAQLMGFQTMVCIPLPNGVVELGSSDLIVESPDLVNHVRALFNGSNATNQIEAPPPPNVQQTPLSQRFT